MKNRPMPIRPPRYTYNQIHGQLVKWIREGTWDYNGKYSGDRYTDLDHFILDFMGEGVDEQMRYDDEGYVVRAIYRLNAKFEKDPALISWLFTENGYALFRTKLAQQAKERYGHHPTDEDGNYRLTDKDGNHGQRPDSQGTEET